METPHIWDRLKGRQQAVEFALRESLDRLCADSPASLQQAMAYSLLAPGKRLRPLMTILACEAVGGTEQAALPAACAVEMVHTYSLIHDDLPAMDDDDLRRGLPTCHKKFGEALAILAGDGLLTLAFELLASSYPAKIASVNVLELARGAGASGMVAGQTLDLLAEGRITSETPLPSQTADSLADIHQRKTGALFRAAMRIGVIVGLNNEKLPRVNDLEPLTVAGKFADAFGLAFQITDDLLDAEGTAENTGKRVGKDAERGKLTYPGLLGVPESRKRAEELVRSAQSFATMLGSEPLAQLAEFILQRNR